VKGFAGAASLIPVAETSCVKRALISGSCFSRSRSFAKLRLAWSVTVTPHMTEALALSLDLMTAPSGELIPNHSGDAPGGTSTSCATSLATILPNSFSTLPA
jgi:hypothetical protein